MQKLVIILAVLVVTVLIAWAYGDDITIIFNSWLEGKPKALVKLNIYIPGDMSQCVILVRRFPTRYNPTEDGYTKQIYLGKRGPGTFVVKDVINMWQVGSIQEDGEVRPVYDSPEYYVAAVCKGLDNETYTYGRIIQTLVKKPIVDIDVKIKPEKVKSGEEEGRLKPLTTGSVQYCTITIDKTSGDPVYGQDYWAKGHCVPQVKLTYLNSISRLKTAFGLEGLQSAMYIEGWDAACDRTDIESCGASFWRSAGKKLTISVVTVESDSASNGQRAVVWGYVYYKYEYYAYYYTDMMIYFIYEILYPAEIRGLPSPQVVGVYTPPSQPPSYAAGPMRGDMSIYFNVNKETDEKLGLSTDVSVSLNFGVLSFAVTITVSPYKAESPQYKSPYVHVYDISGKDYDWYYWWYKNNDPLTYEIEFYGK